MILGLDPVVINNSAYDAFMNASFFKASYLPYTSIIGQWFWAILLLFLLVVTYIRTEDITYVYVYGTLAMLGLGIYGVFPLIFKPFMYLILSISLLLTFYAFFVRQN